MKDLLFTNARVVDASQNLDEIGQIGVHNGCFAAVESLKDPKVIDLGGAVLAPGFIDVHVHLREPGQTHKEDIATGTAAAANGGFTTVLAMPNTLPPPDTPQHVADIQALIAQKACINVLQAGCLSVNREGQAMADIAALHEAGCPAVSDDGSTPQDTALMRSICMAAAACGIPVIDHCEKTSLSKPGVMHRGNISRILGLPGQPRTAETTIVRRDIALARKTGCHVHLQHVSCQGTVELLRKAVEQGVKVTAEVTPHHLFLTDRDCCRYGTNAKMAPPLREEKDRLALVEALCSGLISIIATDHAPHTDEEKAKGWKQAPFGIVGIETVVPLCLTHLVNTGKMSLMRLIECFTIGPARLLNSDRGTLQNGRPADITILDPDADWTITNDFYKSRSHNCPWTDRACKGRVCAVYVAGKLVKP